MVRKTGIKHNKGSCYTWLFFFLLLLFKEMDNTSSIFKKKTMQTLKLTTLASTRALQLTNL
jgi:hypothetical protein